MRSPREIRVAIASIAVSVVVMNGYPSSALAEETWSVVRFGAHESRLSPMLKKSDVEAPGLGTTNSVHAPIFGYAHRWRSGPPLSVASRIERPILEPFDSDDPHWWDEQLKELLHTRVRQAFLIGRGCRNPEDPTSYVGAGGMCPYKLKMMAVAVERAAAENSIRFGMFVDTGGVIASRRIAAAPAGRLLSTVDNRKFKFSLKDESDDSGRKPLWYFWDAVIRPWYDTVPRSLWYTIREQNEERPVIAFWGIGSGFTYQAGNASILLEDIREEFIRRYGVSPFFIVSDSWITKDPQLANNTVIGGVHSWFNTRLGSEKGASVRRWRDGKWEWVGSPGGYSSLTNWNGQHWGVVVAGFDCGALCKVPKLPRDNGLHLGASLDLNGAAKINFVEGFNGPLEGTALIRSVGGDWSYPTQYLEILRRASDPETRRVRLYASIADRQYGSILADQKNLNAIVAAKDNVQFEYRNVKIAAGKYEVTLRGTISAPGALFTVKVGDVDTKVFVPPFDQRMPPFAIGSGGEIELRAGEYDITASSDDAHAKIDWIDLRKIER